MAGFLLKLQPVFGVVSKDNPSWQYGPASTGRQLFSCWQTSKNFRWVICIIPSDRFGCHNYKYTTGRT